MELNAKFSLTDLQDSDNINELLDEDDSKAIGQHCVHNFKVDKESRGGWETKMQDAQELALQITKEKTYPWPKAANIKFPLLTIASLQFASRAYPALVKAPDLVKYRVQGSDPDGAKAARASRISSHMSYQLLEQDEAWEEGQDKAFLALPILGCVFKKSYYDPVKGYNCSAMVLPKNLVVHYYARSLEECERKTEIFQLYEREIRERELRKLFSKNEYGPAPPIEQKDEDKRQGTDAPIDDKDRPRTFLEQHCYLDLDGDGYKEPYIVTVDKASQKVARIVARYAEITSEQSVEIEEIQKSMRMLAESIDPEGGNLQQAQAAEQTLLQMQQKIRALSEEKPKVLSISAVEHYTKYSFIPSPDGGFYDLGFGALLGPLNDSVNTLLNQLIDSGSLANSNTGFVSGGSGIKGGRIQFKINEFKKIRSVGALKDNIYKMDFTPPSPVLFNLLSLLINYAERVGSVTDTMVGENPGQNTPAYNMSAMLEQGLQVFNGIFKRVYRSFRCELRKLYQLNSIYLDSEEYFAYQDSESKALRVDYTADVKDLIPAADPSAFSSKEKMMKAQAVAERAQMVPGYDPINVEQRFLEAMDIPDSAEAYPLVQAEDGSMQLKFPPQPDPEFEIKRAEEQRRTLEAQVRGDVDIMKAESQIMVDEAKVLLMMAQAEVAADTPELERLKLLVQEFGDKRKTLVEMAKIDENRADRAVGTESGKRSSD